MAKMVKKNLPTDALIVPPATFTMSGAIFVKIIVVTIISGEHHILIMN